MARLHGLFGRPFVDLTPLLGLDGLDAVHAEICAALPEAPITYTGGTLRSMGVVAPFEDPEGRYRDANDAIAALDPEEFAAFLALGEDPTLAVATTPRRFGDETPRPMNQAQMRWLEVRHGVYFPWKTCFHFLEDESWDDKHTRGAKEYPAAARALFPKTLAYLEGLPFLEIGRAVLFGVHPNDHAPFHRDAVPGRELSVAHSLNFVPGGGKELVLASPNGGTRVPIDARIYWFNDMDWHGVPAAPTFRYSIRVDGVYDPEFLRAVAGLSPRGGRGRRC